MQNQTILLFKDQVIILIIQMWSDINALIVLDASDV